jgi:hypothetical protein
MNETSMSISLVTQSWVVLAINIYWKSTLGDMQILYGLKPYSRAIQFRSCRAKAFLVLEEPFMVLQRP